MCPVQSVISTFLGELAPMTWGMEYVVRRIILHVFVVVPSRLAKRPCLEGVDVVSVVRGYENIGWQCI